MFISPTQIVSKQASQSRMNTQAGQRPTDRADSSKGSDADVQTLLSQLQHMILSLRDQHGVSCAILGKDGRVVAIDRTGEGETKETEEEKKETAGDHPTQAVTHTHGGRRLQSFGSIVGHELSDVILKVGQHSSSAAYLYACSGETWRSPRLAHASTYVLSFFFLPTNTHRGAAAAQRLLRRALQARLLRDPGPRRGAQPALHRDAGAHPLLPLHRRGARALAARRAREPAARPLFRTLFECQIPPHGRSSAPLRRLLHAPD